MNFIRLFVFADENQAAFSPEVLRQIRANFRLIDDNLRDNPTANRLFLKLLTDARDPEGALRKMNEAGVLGRFVTDFGRIVSMMQFNMYHHFTVDEHLIRTMGFLSGIERGRLSIDHPVSSEVVRTIDNRRALYVAAFLHDIAKGRDEDHSIAGARIARELGPRLGLSAVRDRDGGLAGRAPSDHEPVRSKPRPERSQDHPRLRRDRAEPRAAEAAAHPHRRRYPRGRARHLDRAGRGSSCARSISRPSRCSAAATPR